MAAKEFFLERTVFIFLLLSTLLSHAYFFLSAGSENNSLYLYYKGLSKQLLTFKFDTVRSVLVSS